MRVAIEASTWINPRGYGRFTRELIRALLRAKSPHRFSLVLDAGAVAAASDLPAAEVIPVPTRHTVVSAATANGSRSPADLWRMSTYLSRGFDAVLFPTNYSFVPVQPGRFVTVVIHDAIPETLPELVLGNARSQLLWKAKNRLACWQADLIATVSESSARDIRRLLPVGNRRLVVLTEGASAVFSPEPTAGDEALVTAAVPRAGRFVLFVGGISRHKQVDQLVKAFGIVSATSGNEDLQLVLVGPEDRDQFAVDQGGVRDAIEALGPRKTRVIRTGFVSDQTLAALYRSAECVVLPSMAEGFGLPALEAMSSGAPLVVTATPALQELCGDAAEYVHDIERLSDVVGRLLKDAARRTALRHAGVTRARQFSWDESARRLLAAFDAR